MRSVDRLQRIALGRGDDDVVRRQPLHLLAKPVDMGFDGVRAETVLEAPDLGEKLLLRLNLQYFCFVKQLQSQDRSMIQDSAL